MERRIFSKKRFSLSTVCSRFLASYYVVNTALLLSYLVLRHYIWQYGSDDQLLKLQSWEWQGFVVALTGAFVAISRRALLVSVEQLVAEVFKWGKLLLAAIALTLDARIFCWYILLYAAVFITCPQKLPPLGTADIEMLTGAQLKTKVMAQGTGTTWLVSFFSPASKRCVHFEPLFAELAMRYSTPALQFGRLDVSSFGGSAALLGIPVTSPLSLPTLILFEDGVEVTRMPKTRDSDGTIVSGKQLHERAVVATFELDMRFARSAHKKLLRKKAAK